MKKILTLIILITTVLTSFVYSQKEQQDNSYISKSWKYVATKMPDEWYGSNDAKRVAENVLICQKDIGGWAKNKPYHHLFSEAEKTLFVNEKPEIGATFDNGATITELKFLAKVFLYIKDNRYKQAFEKGIDYIFVSQYENGGWPQFFPFRDGKTVSYSKDITYNDNAMVNIMLFLKDLSFDDEKYRSMQIGSEVKEKARKAFDKGVECIINTQIIVDGHKTVWCAQHDAITLAPSNARKYELASFSGAESVGITSLLMDIDNPSNEIVIAVNGALKWFENNRIEGVKLETEIDSKGRKNLIVVEDKTAPSIWARFYDLETRKPFFCDRDGIKKDSLQDIGYERRNGYSWYTYAPAGLFIKFEEWKKKWNVK